jgi:hypothetical protein
VKVACLILAHQRPHQLARLLHVLDHPRLRLYLHIDRRARMSDFQRTLDMADAPAPALLERRRTRWGGAEVVDVVLEGLERGLAEGCDYFLLVSGQDFPLQSPESLIGLLAEAPDRTYMAHWGLPTERWRFGGRDRLEFYAHNILGRRETCIPTGEDVGRLSRRGRALNGALRLLDARKPPRAFPGYLRPYGGWSWWNMSGAAARYVVEFVRDHPGYRRYHEFTLSADEIFFHSILCGTSFAQTHEVLNDSLRFTIWSPGSSHPDVLTSDKLPQLLGSEMLFARKFDEELDAAVLDQLTARITS